MLSALLAGAVWWRKVCKVPFFRTVPLWVAVQVYRIHIWWIRPGDDEPFGW